MLSLPSRYGPSVTTGGPSGPNRPGAGGDLQAIAPAAVLPADNRSPAAASAIPSQPSRAGGQQVRRQAQVALLNLVLDRRPGHLGIPAVEILRQGTRLGLHLISMGAGQSAGRVVAASHPRVAGFCQRSGQLSRLEDSLLADSSKRRSAQARLSAFSPND